MSLSGCRGPKRGRKKSCNRRISDNENEGGYKLYSHLESELVYLWPKIASVKVEGKPVQGKSEAGSNSEAFIWKYLKSRKSIRFQFKITILCRPAKCLQALGDLFLNQCAVNTEVCLPVFPHQTEEPSQDLGTCHI